MPLQKIQFKPGFNKMVTASGAESQWIDGDFVRFRYGLPEKIGVGPNLQLLIIHYQEQLDRNTRGLL